MLSSFVNYFGIERRKLSLIPFLKCILKFPDEFFIFLAYGRGLIFRLACELFSIHISKPQRLLIDDNDS